MQTSIISFVKPFPCKKLRLKKTKLKRKLWTRQVRTNRFVEIVQFNSDIIDNVELEISWLFMEAIYYKILRKDSRLIKLNILPDKRIFVSNLIDHFF